jgi:hypothetical protein
MAVTTSLVFDIRPIASVQRCDGSVQLTFRDGSVARLDASHPHFDTLMVFLESEAHRCRPVGLVLAASAQVIDLNEAHDVTVRYIRDNDETPDRLKVALWGFSPMCYLARDHPEFERIRSTLAAAAGAPARLWLANHSQMVQDEPTTNGGEFEMWWKIMDVRPEEPAARASATEAGAAANQGHLHGLSEFKVSQNGPAG